MTQIPRPPDEYQEEPFDPDLTFEVDGITTRHIESPLSENYVSEPIDRFVARGIPPEEREVRDHLLIAHYLRTKVTRPEFWWSQFFKESKRFMASREAFGKLEALCSKSPEHRAAFLRIANGEAMPPGIRSELRRIVLRKDKAKLGQLRQNGTQEF